MALADRVRLSVTLQLAAHELTDLGLGRVETLPTTLWAMWTPDDEHGDAHLLRDESACSRTRAGSSGPPLVP